jgi:Fe2+ or Zn2+ uptake regulation protein
MSQIQGALKVLKKSGYKVTEQRKRVLRVLSEVEKPVSPYEIQTILQQRDEYLNHVTIYRILDLFCDLNLAHRVLLKGGFVKCTLGDGEGCHRFIICRGCGALKEYADKELCKEEILIASDLGFRTGQHYSEFYGFCAKCDSQFKLEQKYV